MRRQIGITTLLLFALSLFAVALPGRSEAAGYNIVVNGNRVANVQTEMVRGTLMVEVRPFVGALGGSVSWDAADSRVSVAENGSQVALWIGSHTAFQDGSRIWAPEKPFLENSHAMVPAWWLAERLGAQPSFDGGTLSVNSVGAANSGSAATPADFLMNPGYFFPFPSTVAYDPYYDSWGAARYYNGKTTPHEGTDILTKKGNPIVAVAAGTIVRYGWNTLGGYRLAVELDDHPGYKFYYAHMDRYSPDLYLGAHVTAGQFLGYVGNTGDGPERTEGKFVPHLHFGIYGPDWKAIDSYSFLKYWEQHKVQW